MTRILIIEDDQDIRELLKDVLDDEGFDVLVAADGEAGSKIWRAEPIDLVITDILMPEMDGIETIAELHRQRPEVSVIAISGGGRLDPKNYLESAELLGAVSSLLKPFGRKELLQEVARALET